MTGLSSVSALKSWKLLDPDVEVIVFGEDEGAAQVVLKLILCTIRRSSSTGQAGTGWTTGFGARAKSRGTSTFATAIATSRSWTISCELLNGRGRGGETFFLWRRDGIRTSRSPSISEIGGGATSCGNWLRPRASSRAGIEWICFSSARDNIRLCRRSWWGTAIGIPG